MKSYMHQVNLGEALDEARINQVLGRDRASEVVNAVLQRLRNKCAEINEASHTPPPVLPQPGDYRAYHDGAANVVEELFWEIAEPLKGEAPEAPLSNG